MKIGCYQTYSQDQSKRGRKKKFNYKNCRHCGSDNLISVGVDQLCCDCDWNTALEYVQKGYMNNFSFAYLEHFSKKKKPTEVVPILPQGNSPVVQSPKPSKNKKIA